MKNKHIGEKIFNVVNFLIIIIFTIMCFYPFYYVFIYSLSDPNLAASKGVYLWPVGFTTNTFQKLLGGEGIFGAVFISASRAVFGTLITIFCSSLFAYILTKEQLFLRKYIYRFVILTMYISAGLIPWYMTMMSLGLKNSYLLYILPSAVVGFYIVLLKTYIESIPPSLEESAMIDGAGYLTRYTKIIMPLCKPIIATVSIFSAVSQWNQWQDNFYLVSDSKLMTLQLMLYNFLRSTQATSLSSSFSAGLSQAQQITPMSIKMTMAMISILPIIIVYPALQKHFAKGIMIGAIKG